MVHTKESVITTLYGSQKVVYKIPLPTQNGMWRRDMSTYPMKSSTL